MFRNTYLQRQLELGIEGIQVLKSKTLSLKDTRCLSKPFSIVCSRVFFWGCYKILKEQVELRE